MAFWVSDTVLYLALFHPLSNWLFLDFWHGSWCSVTFAVEDDSISSVSKSVEGGRSQESVREGVAPFFEVEVACGGSKPTP